MNDEAGKSGKSNSAGVAAERTWRGGGRFLDAVSLLMVLFALGFLVASCFRIPVDADSFFHLATARNWFEYGLSPLVDHLSFTHYGEPVRGQPIAFQVMLYGFVRMFGVEAGFVAMKLTFMLLTFATVAWMAWRTRTTWPFAAFAIAVLVFALQTRAQARPELGILWFTALAMFLYHRTLAGPDPGVKAANMIPVAILVAVWVAWYNAIFAYVIFFGLFVDLALRQWRRSAPRDEWAQWFAWGLLVFVLGWGPPDFSHDFFGVLNFSNEWIQLIREWEPPVRYLELTGTWVLAVAAVVAMLLCVRYRAIGLLIVLVVFIQQVLQISRLVAPAGIVIVCSLLHLFALQRKALAAEGRPKPEPRWLSALILALAILPLISSAQLASRYLNWDSWRGSAWPSHLAEHLRESWPPGRVFNQMVRGGYLAYELGPEYPIYIDGRVQLLYPLEFFKHHLAVGRSAAALQAELSRYDADYLVVSEGADSDRFLHELQGWTLDFADVNDLLYVRADGRFPLSGVLRHAPECWRPEMAAGLRKERDNAERILPPRNGLTPLLQHLAEDSVVATTREATALADFDVAENWRSARFLAYRAFDEGRDDRVIGLLTPQPYRYFKDGLLLALSHLRAGQVAEARSWLSRLLSTSWLQFEQADLAGVSVLFAELERRDALADMDVAGIRGFLNEAGYWPPRDGVETFRTLALCHREVLPSPR